MFPMEVTKIPQLQSMLTEFEFQHIESFPSILRLLIDGSLLQDLCTNMAGSKSLESISFYRVIDNTGLSMDAENFWVHLNFQLIHLLDFLPVACWGVNWDEPLMQLFLGLHNFLRTAGKLQAQVVVPDVEMERRLDGQPNTMAAMLVRMVPSQVKKKLSAGAVRNYSKEIGHSLSFETRWTVA